MADINSKPLPADAANGAARPVLAARDQAPATVTTGNLLKFVELLFFAYRDFTGDADELLADLGYGRAHHRVIHFVARHPGLRVADLLDILRITKQSLAPVLKQLIDEGFVRQASGKTDRRERLVFLTQKGQNFAEMLAELQCARVGNALESAGLDSEGVIEDFLFAMISDKDRAAVAALFEAAQLNEPDSQRRVSDSRPGNEN